MNNNPCTFIKTSLEEYNLTLEDCESFADGKIKEVYKNYLL